MSNYEIFQLVLQLAVFPLGILLYTHHEKINKLNIQVGVQQAQLEGQKALNEQTYQELRHSFNVIVTKLDSIEQFLRK